MEMYHFRETVVIEAPIELVWAAMVEPAWQRWNPSFTKMELRDGPPLQLGSVIDNAVRGGLPFTLGFTTEVTELHEPTLIEIRSWGEVQGTGRWSLQEHPDGTVFTYYWDVGLTNRFLDRLGRFAFAKRILARNHDKVMKATFEAMKEELTIDRLGTKP